MKSNLGKTVSVFAGVLALWPVLVFGAERCMAFCFYRANGFVPQHYNYASASLLNGVKACASDKLFHLASTLFLSEAVNTAVWIACAAAIIYKIACHYSEVGKQRSSLYAAWLIAVVFSFYNMVAVFPLSTYYLIQIGA